MTPGLNVASTSVKIVRPDRVPDLKLIILLHIVQASPGPFVTQGASRERTERQFAFVNVNQRGSFNFVSFILNDFYDYRLLVINGTQSNVLLTNCIE